MPNANAIHERVAHFIQKWPPFHLLKEDQLRALDHYRNPDEMPQGSFQLSEVCKHLNIPIKDLHTAEGDALATAILFTKLLKILQKRGVKTLKELL